MKKTSFSVSASIITIWVLRSFQFSQLHVTDTDKSSVAENKKEGNQAIWEQAVQLLQTKVCSITLQIV